MASCRRSPVTMLAGVLAAFALLAACALTGPAVTTVHAWGYVGHQLTATVAQQLLSKDAELGVEQVLSHDRGNMTRVATWADEVKRQQRYRWSSTLHYVNPHDDEPASCGYDHARDCPGDKCIVGAIFNFSATYDPTVRTPKETRSESLKFLIHFIGDIHQPLHVSGRGKGGNDASVRFNGALANLHGVWDYAMIEKRISEDFGGSYARFAEHIRHRLDTEWAAEARSDWIACDRHPRGLALHSTRAQVAFAGSVEETQVFASRACADLWAAQINRLDCSSVWQGIHDGVELSGEYYRANIQLIEKLIAMGGVRLAAVLNGYQY